MRDGGNNGIAAAEQPLNKHKHSSITKLSQSQSQSSPHYSHSTKKRKLTSQTETLTLNHFNFTSHTHTRTSSYSNKRQKYEKQRRRKTRDRSSDSEGNRHWVYSSRDCSNYKDKIVFLSYNILGVENASKHQDLYCNNPPRFLDWDRRKKMICKEINLYNPSILCFQEVDHFHDLDNLLRKDGFIGVYQARTGEACDGCAIFWKKELFTLLHQENIEFQRYSLRNNVAQLCVFKLTQNQANIDASIHSPQALPSQSLVVGNIHVLFNPNRGDIKLGQIRLFLEKAHNLSQEWGSTPVVLCGDLNSLPQSAMYHFLASCELDVQLHDRRKLSGQICPLEYPAFQSQSKNAARPIIHRWSNEELRLATGSEGVTSLIHHLKLSSAYAGVPGSFRTRDNLGEPLATSYHSKFMGTVDYIWHTDKLVPVRVLETLPIDALRKTGGLPSKKWGSDHLALVCELALANDDNGT